MIVTTSSTTVIPWLRVNLASNFLSASTIARLCAESREMTLLAAERATGYAEVGS